MTAIWSFLLASSTLPLLLARYMPCQPSELVYKSGYMVLFDHVACALMQMMQLTFVDVANLVCMSSHSSRNPFGALPVNTN